MLKLSDTTSLSDQKSPQYTIHGPKKSVTNDQAFIKKITDSFKAYRPTSEDKALSGMNDFIKKILEQLAEANLGKISYSECLLKIIEQSRDLFKTIKTMQSSAEDAWFLWKHSSFAHIHYHYDEILPSKKGQQFLAIAQRLGKMTNQAVFRGGFTDLVNNEKSEEKIVKQEDIEKNKKLALGQLEQLEDLIMTDENLEELAVLAILCSRIVQETGIGNCREKCFVALKLLNDSRPKLGIGSDDFQAEIFSIKGGDHVFVVIGRKPDSDPSDYTTWGKDAVICDPWSEQYYFASALPEKLKNFVAIERADKSILRKLEPIHPHHHTLAEDLHISEIPAAEKFLSKYEKYISQSTGATKTSAMALDSDSDSDSDMETSKTHFKMFPNMSSRVPASNSTQIKITIEPQR